MMVCKITTYLTSVGLAHAWAKYTYLHTASNHKWDSGMWLVIYT